jgi:hypothetical protein
MTSRNGHDVHRSRMPPATEILDGSADKGANQKLTSSCDMRSWPVTRQS